MKPELTQPQDHPNEPLLEAQLVQTRQIGEETNGLLEAILAQGQQNSPEPVLEATLAQSIKNTDRIVEVLSPASEATSQMAAFLREMQGPPGKDGHTPTDDELVALIQPLIPEPVPGADGHTPSPEELAALITPLIPAPTPGKDGQDGKPGKDGKNGKASTVPGPQCYLQPAHFAGFFFLFWQKNAWRLLFFPSRSVLESSSILKIDASLEPSGTPPTVGG